MLKFDPINKEDKQAIVAEALELCNVFLPSATLGTDGRYCLKSGKANVLALLFTFPFPFLVGVPEWKAVVIVAQENPRLTIWDASVFGCEIVVNSKFPAQGSA